MRRTGLRTLSLFLVSFTVTLAGSLVFAHSTGHESRTVGECERLPGTAKEGERAQCIKCVTRPKKHHYHPDNPEGNRCRPDDGKP
jgi:hypothetical protein